MSSAPVENGVTFAQCLHCERFSLKGCPAFPDGIPEEILNNRVDHRNPYKRDNGIQFESRHGFPIDERWFTPFT